ncbi:glycosyltransferase family 2 protein [Calothrix sp. NIES-2098]|uniref:glycosyltransferase family 2 protein n=1 Tax=Calothrix sp. NIES-2098 TaxID=1954171 RepID=UPI000B60CF6A|nr:putative glycosyltransferase [Calothrix sp. NIES-2098]
MNTTTKEPVYIIIPVHNRKQITLNCLEHLQKTGDLQRYYVVVVDDASTDGTAEAIQSLYAGVTVLPGNGDLWWTGAIAKGMEYAYTQKAEYFIWLNDDCLPNPGTLPQLVDFLKNRPNSIAAPTCYIQQDNSLIKQYNGSQGRKNCAANLGEVIEVDSMSGWCVGIPVSVFGKIGSPNAEKFPHYCGDDMYIFKATRSGFKAYLLGDLKTILIGPVNEMGNFQKYFRPGLPAKQTLRSLFWNKKSPYRLPTKFFYFVERYGVFLGSLLFLLKLTTWFKEWAYLQLSLSKN